MGKLIIYTDNNLATSLASLTDTKLLLGSDKLDVTDTNHLYSSKLSYCNTLNRHTSGNELTP